MEKHFRITWTIDQFAENPLEALKKAILALPNENTNEADSATIFTVDETDEDGIVVKSTDIDMLEQNPFNPDYLDYATDCYVDEKEPMTMYEWEDEKEQEKIALDKTMDKIRNENF